MKYSFRDIVSEQNSIFKSYSAIYYVNMLQGTIDTLKSWFPNGSRFDYSKMAAYTPVIGSPSLEKITTEYDSWFSWDEPQENKDLFGPREKQFLLEFYISYLANQARRQNENYSEQNPSDSYSDNASSYGNDFHQYLVDFVTKQKGHWN